MSTVNISLPLKLKAQANNLVKAGYYSSFSDLIRDSLRKLLDTNKYDIWADEAKSDLKKHKAVVLKTDKEVEDYFQGL